MRFYKRRGFSVSLITVLSLVSASCNQGRFEVMKDPIAVNIPTTKKITKENYMNGEQFCAKYVNTSDPLSYEVGKWIDVPFDYTNNKAKLIKIYAYTKKTFDPQLPSFIHVNGGPGQNSHTRSDTVDSGVNEIYFDQRGVGCSAPPTWEDYIDQALYSSLTTAKDIDEIRKVYSIEKVSVYGISYGTVPATIYANLFEKNIKSVVLEGVVGKVENLSRHTYEVEKYNLILKGLNSAQKKAFESIIFSDDEIKTVVLWYFLGGARYQDGGYRIVRDNIFQKLFPEAGGVDEDLFKAIYENISKEENQYNTAQYPGGVDENVLMRFYCKELGGFSKDKFGLTYSSELGFTEQPSKHQMSWAEDCGRHGITEKMETLYDERSYSTGAPVYYFQGSHDGATIAEGALNHWKTVPKNKTYFLLSLKGGHNPAMSKIRSSDAEISKLHKQLFTEALTAQPITLDFVKKINASITNSTDKFEKKFNYITWAMFTANKSSSSDIEKEFKGLRRLSARK